MLNKLIPFQNNENLNEIYLNEMGTMSSMNKVINQHKVIAVLKAGMVVKGKIPPFNTQELFVIGFSNDFITIKNYEESELYDFKKLVVLCENRRFAYFNSVLKDLNDLQESSMYSNLYFICKYWSEPKEDYIYCCLPFTEVDVIPPTTDL